MTDQIPNRGSNRLTFLSVVVVLLLGVYFGAYYALVYRALPPVSNIAVGERYRHASQYETGPLPIHSVLSTAFEPAHWLDQKIRPDYWNPMFTPSGWTP